MRETNLDCCVVRDLLPSYLEELTETETSAMVREHIEHCAACRQLEEDMRRQVPIEKAPQRALRFLKRVKRTRLIAAILSALVALFCIGWLYDLEFHYANTEAGRLEAVCDYIPSPEGNTISGVEAGTPVRAVSWQTIDNHLLIFFAADNEENVHGVMHALEDGNVKAECVVTDEGNEILEIKNIAVDPENQGKGYGKALIDFLASKYADEYSILQVGTGDSPLTVPFYEKCGFVRSHNIPNFFTDNYDHPIYECGVHLVDMVYLQRPL